MIVLVKTGLFGIIIGWDSPTGRKWNIQPFPTEYRIYYWEVGYMKLIDLTGQRFGFLVVLERAENKGKHTCWLCKCDCGNEKIISGKSLRKGLTISCGCYAKEQRRKATTKHGFARTRLNYLYDRMKHRCYSTKDKYYKNYGARGIKVCEEWLKDSRNFYRWAIENGFDENAPYMKCTLDRIDVNGDYSPENCRFVDIKTQCNNRTTNFLITYDGLTMNATGWGKKKGLNPSTIIKRIKSGWNIKEALETPLCKNQYDRQCIEK
jgi:hypothetical protein